MTTWREALLDPSIPIHWLLEIDAGGLTWRFADTHVIVGSHHHLGALDMIREPSLDSDPYQGETSMIVSTVALRPIPDGGPDRPLFRPHDLADTFRAEYIGLPARLYRWAYGTAESERDPIIDGNVSSAIVRQGGELEIEVADFSLRYSRLALPPYVIDTEIWPNADEDDVGRRAPIVCGTFAGLEVPKIATGGKQMIGHHIGTLTGGAIDGVSSTPVLTNTADADGIEYAEADYPAATAGATVTANGTGALDDADGTYSGTADALLTHTADQLHWLAREIVGIPAALIDANAFVALREITISHLNTLIIGADDKVNFFQVSAVALLPYRGSVFVERGKLTARALDFDAPPVFALRDGELLIAMEEIEWQGYKDVPAGIEFKYAMKWNRKKKQYATSQVFKIAAEDYPPFAKSQALGGEMLRAEYPYVRDAATIEALAANIQELHSFNRRLVKVRVGRECHGLLLYAPVTLSAAEYPSADGAGCEDKRFAVIGITYGAEESTLTLLEC